jgi:hypothetical protein
MRPQFLADLGGWDEEGASETIGGFLGVEPARKPILQDEVAQLVSQGEALSIARPAFADHHDGDAIRAHGRPSKLLWCSASDRKTRMPRCSRVSVRSGIVGKTSAAVSGKKFADVEKRLRLATCPQPLDLEHTLKLALRED